VGAVTSNATNAGGDNANYTDGIFSTLRSLSLFTATGSGIVTNLLTFGRMTGGSGSFNNLLLTNTTASYTASNFNYYEEYNSTLAFSGAVATNINQSYNIIRSGKNVVFTAITSNSSGASSPSGIFVSTTAIPSRFRPNSWASAPTPIRILAANANQFGIGQVGTDGIVRIYSGINNDAFPITSVNGWSVFTLVWTLL